MKEFLFTILMIVLLAVLMLAGFWNAKHCVSDISFSDVVGWKEKDGHYYAELDDGTLKEVRYASYYEREIRYFVYDVKICDGKVVSRDINNWFTYQP